MRPLFLFVLSNLLFGILFYAKFRSESIYINRLFCFVTLNKFYSSSIILGSLPSFLGSNIVFGTALLIALKWDKPILPLLKFSLLTLLILEVSQILIQQRAVFDWFDLLFTVLSAIFSTIFYFITIKINYK